MDGRKNIVYNTNFILMFVMENHKYRGVPQVLVGLYHEMDDDWG